MHADLVLRGAEVHDGTGAPAVVGDVAVRGDRIVAVGGAPVAAGRAVDARGLAVAPGFIDVHSHDDFAVLLDPQMPEKVLQGVTTEIVGNCGLGAAPFREARASAAMLHPGRTLPAWEGYAGYLAALDRDPPSLNVAALVGHGALRLAVLGTAPEPPGDAALDRMRALLREGLEAGAVGYSTGLIYEPGRHARTEELVALAREMRGTGALYATHMRDESRGLLDSIRETLRVAEEGEVPVQVSHHKAAGRGAWGLVKDSLRLLEEARACGLDVAADQYPYTSASTMLGAVSQNGWLAGAPGGGGARMLESTHVRIASSAVRPEWDGRTLQEIDESASAHDVAQQVLAIDPAVWVVVEMMCEEDVRAVLRHPTTLIGSDGLPTAGKPHPRLAGTFPRVLGHYARDEGVLTLPEAVHRMTGASATRFGLRDRGFVRAGAYADLVVFDPARILDRATTSDPRRPPDGIAHVFVNGVEVARDGVHTGARPGRALRRA